MVVAPLVPAAGVEIADSMEETASSVGAPMEVQAPVVVAAARDCVHTGVHQEQIHQKVAHQAAKGRFGFTHHADSSLEAQCSASALLWGMKLVTMKT